MVSCRIDVEKGEDVSENIKRLREITPLMDFSNLISVNSTPFVKLNMIEGDSFMIGLHKEKDIAVAREFASAGTKFPVHFHEELEYIIVYKGSVEIGIDNGKIILNKGDFIRFEEGKTHSAFFLEDTWFLAITIPASKDWPGEREV